MQVEVKAIKADLKKVKYDLVIDQQDYPFNGKAVNASRTLTNTSNEDGRGIFNDVDISVWFIRDDVRVYVDFGSAWNIETYENPALEIKRRVELVNAAFEEVKESWEKSWTVEI
ncbi:MAG: hypothetical protein IM526_12795 [Microcystis sp. M38BS1]|uniref:hypothetical protein n=1 Tax=Microcystis sp. M38BS1 TaxID=2771188 RepID=UPI0031FD3C26|nr:hypothetical protein [Microcystis sp. M38BS1]MCA6584459.1 hypothetical protein [Pseudanabaena sp. M34BS1SP1A06MG]